jgi:hypothetical protein
VLVCLLASVPTALPNERPWPAADRATQRQTSAIEPEPPVDTLMLLCHGHDVKKTVSSQTYLQTLASDRGGIEPSLFIRRNLSFCCWVRHPPPKCLVRWRIGLGLVARLGLRGSRDSSDEQPSQRPMVVTVVRKLKQLNRKLLLGRLRSHRRTAASQGSCYPLTDPPVQFRVDYVI